MKASLVVHSFNEGPALERLILSSLHATDTFDEWVVLDHRSSDDTQVRLDALEAVLEAHGITLTRLFEKRDLSARHTFAHVRDRTIHAAKNEIVALMDADFILGRAFAPTLASALRRFSVDARLAAVRFRIPILWDHLKTDAEGRITSHGRLYRHGFSHRILRQTKVKYRQDGNGGKWEKAHYPGMRRLDIINDGNILISLNAKPPERIELRATMTEFMQDALSGAVGGEWLQHDPKALRTQPEYQFRPERIAATLNLANLEVSA